MSVTAKIALMELDKSDWPSEIKDKFIRTHLESKTEG